VLWNGQKVAFSRFFILKAIPTKLENNTKLEENNNAQKNIPTNFGLTRPYDGDLCPGKFDHRDDLYIRIDEKTCRLSAYQGSDRTGPNDAENKETV
jgi:hypothetical protein